MKEKTLNQKCILRFKEHLRHEEKSENTIEKYLRDIVRFSEFLKGRSVTKEQVIAFKGYLQEHYKTRSVNSMIASINSLFGFLGWNELKVKQLRLQQQVFCSESQELTRDEYERLCRTAIKKQNERLNLILQTICGTGIRVSELQFITVEAVERGEAYVSLKGKNRTVFLVKPLRAKLMEFAREKKIKCGPLFVTRTGKPMSRTNIWREMKNLCDEAKVSSKKVFPHNLRHLFAREFYGIEKDIAKLADILGHSSINTTRIYLTSTGHEHERKMERMRLII